MAKPKWTPWHEVVKLREDVKSGELSLASFAADLYDVAAGKGAQVYRKPEEFFALTYPTYNLRELAKDVVKRLLGKSEKAVRQLVLTYGGGKTHALITLYHLVHEPERLPDLPAVHEFKEHIGAAPPKTRVVVMPFDKLDLEKGIEVQSPEGRKRWLKNPWSVLAYQVAGGEGLKLLHAENKPEERDSAPAENLLGELLAIPTGRGIPLLILIDEVLMFARGKVGMDESWRIQLSNFFQYLTQAVVKCDRCAMVVSLLATEPRMSDNLGRMIASELQAIFSRELEEGVLPVVKEDVAEVLRRRFFAPESIKDRDRFRQHAVAALQGINALDEQSQQEGKAAEDRYVASYPFHPDLLEVLYAKWTSLENFQRTRGILRTFALAMRDAEKWDESPLVGPNVFLAPSGRADISEAIRELVGVADQQHVDGAAQNWTAILASELSKAQQIQTETGMLKYRELEQAVLATFVHSQPTGKKATIRELLRLVGHTRPDRIELERALLGWADVSWFLDEEAFTDIEVVSEGKKELPKTWRLGPRPNLRRMHAEAKESVAVDLVEAKLREQIGSLKSLTQGVSGFGAKAHVLPVRPSDIADDGDFHFAVLDPKASSDPGRPVKEALRYLDETTGPDRPRVYRNAVVLVVPSRDGLEAARDGVRDYLGWEEVCSRLADKQLDPVRAQRLNEYTNVARKKLPDAIKQAYCVVVTVSEKNTAQAFKVAIDDRPLFTLVKADSRSRIQDQPISAEALLPGGPYDLWKKGETARRVKDLVGAFAQFPHLPKMLQTRQVLDTLVLGAKEGHFVLRVTRPDKSIRTFWRAEPDTAALDDPSLELLLAEAATLNHLPTGLLAPDVLPGLWGKAEVKVSEVHRYFRGGNKVKVKRDGYEETQVVPEAERQVVEAAIRDAVKEGTLWLVSGPASVMSEDIPAGVLTDDALLLPPPAPIPVTDLLPEKLPEAWEDYVTTALALATALSRRAGRTLPWIVVRNAIESAMNSRLLEATADSANWPCDLAGAGKVKLRVPSDASPPPKPKPEGLLVAEAELKPNEIQDLADMVGKLTKLAAGSQLKFTVKVELGGETKPSAEIVEALNKELKGVSKDLRLE